MSFLADKSSDEASDLKSDHPDDNRSHESERSTDNEEVDTSGHGHGKGSPLLENTMRRWPPFPQGATKIDGALRNQFSKIEPDT